MFACNYAPRDWAFCNGQLLPISQNTALFSLIGQTYGGDGRSTCGLPNLSDRIPMHPGRGPGLTSRRLGDRIGSETVQLVEAQMPPHNHSLVGVGETGTTQEPTTISFMSEEGGNRKEQTTYISTEKTTNTNLSSQVLTNTGGSRAHENNQPFLGVNFCIALQGIYPSRG
ncbi:tail fiber protein [Colwellia sp. E2M01]|uniref:phage tail protein n=1 Tax=Colwellia sp. E2M01 TaxID=2841561 RepID=UPI002090BCCC|nr:tail fiber protein [Colwellia sp. E2M01]